MVSCCRHECHKSPEGRMQDRPEGHSFRLALGLERIGLFALRIPLTVSAMLACFCVGAFFGVERIKVDDSLSQLFRSDTPEFKQYEEVARRFPSSEYYVLIVVEGKSLLERASLAKLRYAVPDLQLLEG